MSRKILYSPGYGAGWTSWESNPELKKFMLEYQPFIDILESNDTEAIKQLRGSGRDFGTDKIKHPAVQAFLDECQEKFNNTPYIGGIRDLHVKEVRGLVRIEEYDGFESVHESYDDWL